MKIKAFTLVEIAAVIAIMIILISISIPLINKTSFHKETKFAAYSISKHLESTINLARSANKIYIMDMNLGVKDSITDPKSTDTLFAINSMKIYSVIWDEIATKMKYSYSGESYEISYPVKAYINIQNPNQEKADYIYFKPDGSISTREDTGPLLKIIVFQPEKEKYYFRIDLDKINGQVFLYEP